MVLISPPLPGQQGGLNVLESGDVSAKLTTFFTSLVFPASRVDDPPKGCLSRHGLNPYPLQEISSCTYLRGVSPSSGHSHHLSLDLFPPNPGSPMTLKTELCFISAQALAQA